MPLVAVLSLLLFDLGGAAAQQAPNDPTAVAVARAKALREALTQTPEGAAPVLLPGLILTHPELRAAINGLFDPLDKVEEVDFLKAVERRSNSLKTLLGTTSDLTPPPTSLSTIRALNLLQTAIKNYQQQPAPVVDILHAEYGDIGTGASPPRRGQLCDATAAMRKECQGQQSCKLPTTFPGTPLCSTGDPAAFAAGRDKGVWLVFRCLDARTLTVYPVPRLPGMRLDYGDAVQAPLRIASDEFTCVPKPAEPRPKS